MKAFDEHYNGEWANNAKMGMGVYLWPNGDTYEGEFISDFREGKGTYFWKDKTVLEGWWQADHLNGEAKFTDADDKKSDLIFVNGKLLQIWNNNLDIFSFLISSSSNQSIKSINQL